MQLVLVEYCPHDDNQTEKIEPQRTQSYPEEEQDLNKPPHSKQLGI